MLPSGTYRVGDSILHTLHESHIIAGAATELYPDAMATVIPGTIGALAGGVIAWLAVVTAGTAAPTDSSGKLFWLGFF